MQPEILKFEDIVKGCLKRWKTILAVTVLGVILGVTLASTNKENISYEGIFKISVKNDLYDVNSANNYDNTIDNCMELIRTKDFMDKAIQRTELSDEINGKVALKSLVLIKLDKSDFIQIKYLGKTEKESREILNGIYSELKDEFIDNKNISLEQTDSIDINKIDNSKSKKSILVVFIFGGLFGGIFIAFVLECLDKTFKTYGELERELNINVLGNLPKVNKGTDRLINSNNIDKSYLEAIKSLALDIKYGEKNKSLKSIAVVSTSANEGNTTVTSNLALMLSESSKVMLLDADMSKNSISKLLNIDHKKGLSNILLNDVTDAIYKYNENLDIIISGSVSNSIDSIDRKEFNDLLIDLKNKYDYIIINTPAITKNSDYKAILSKVDGVLLNIKAESTKKNSAKEALKSINYLGVNLVGLIFNFGDKFRNKYYQ